MAAGTADLDANQCIQQSYDPSYQALQVSVVATAAEAATTVKIEDSAGNPLTSTTGSLNVNLTGGTLTVSNESKTFDGTGNPIGSTSGALNVQIENSSLPLPPGAATSANQTTEISNLQSIVSNTTGIATASNQNTANSTLSTIATNTTGVATASLQNSQLTVLDSITNQLPTGIGSHTSGGSLSVVIASDQVVPVTASNLPLPIGAATSANQATEIASLSTIATNTTGVALASNQTSVQGSVNGGTAATSSELSGGVYRSSSPSLTNGQQAALALDSIGNLMVTAKQQTTPWTVADTANVSIGGGTGTVATGVAGRYNSSLPTLTSGQSAGLQVDSSARLIISPLTSSSVVSCQTVGTLSANAPVYNAYTSTSITTTAYTQLVASTSNTINTIHIFDSSGQAMILGIGGSGSEVAQLYVPPGGDTYTLNIPAGSRISYKALTANATAGYLLMSFLE